MTELSPAAKDALFAQARLRCLEEWESVNDPPCHPSDKDWDGCGTCADRIGLAAALRSIEKSISYVDDYGDRCIDSNQLLAIADQLASTTSGND